jgi:alkylation response protein AidB-like acyl-CoA dehydrogenase
MLSGDLSASHRYLPMAKVAFIDLGDESAALDLAGLEVVASDAIFAYPYGRFARPPDLAAARRLGPGSGAVLRQWWRVSIAIEIAAAMQAGLDFTIAYVKERRVFGRPIGSFQAVQHRLAKIAQLARNLRLMALKAAWSGDAAQAGMACAFGQKAIPRTVFDLHQFNGAMGMTTEHQLHLWTMRLRSLQGELGGVDGAAIAAAKAAWG